MPIVNYQGSRQVEFGTGDILVSPGLLDMEQVVGVVCFTGNGTGVIGDRTDHEPATILEAGDTPVRLTFEKAESIDVVIRMLEEAKEMMLAKISEQANGIVCPGCGSTLEEHCSGIPEDEPWMECPNHNCDWFAD